MAERNDDPAHIAAVAAMAEKRGCTWPGHPCGRDIPEFCGRDAECLCESIVDGDEPDDDHAHDHACCPPDDCCGGPCAAHPCWEMTADA